MLIIFKKTFTEQHSSNKKTTLLYYICAGYKINFLIICTWKIKN